MTISRKILHINHSNYCYNSSLLVVLCETRFLTKVLLDDFDKNVLSLNELVKKCVYAMYTDLLWCNWTEAHSIECKAWNTIIKRAYQAVSPVIVSTAIALSKWLAKDLLLSCTKSCDVSKAFCESTTVIIFRTKGDVSLSIIWIHSCLKSRDNVEAAQ